jgi:hypothetical protein
MNDFAFIVTAYKQIDLVKQNIERIRFKYQSSLKDSPIIVVSTSETPVGFEELDKQYKNINFIPYPNAPGSIDHKGMPSPDNSKAGGYVSWRHEFLPRRILFSIQLAMQVSDFIGVKKIIHLHSDTYIHENYEYKLLNHIKLLDDYMVLADLALDEEASSPLPPLMHWQPEGLMLNLEKCKKCGYGFRFNTLYKGKSWFQTHNWGSLEAILAQAAVKALTGKDILSKNDVIPQEYYDNVYFKDKRTHHGMFPTGLVNIPGGQPDAIR